MSTKVKTNCFAYKGSCKKEGCAVLCLSKKCAFFKTDAQYREDLARYPVTDPKYL